MHFPTLTLLLATLTSAAVLPRATLGALGGPAPAVQSSGDAKRPFLVNGNTFVNEAAAVQRACDIQQNACMNAFNSNSKGAGFTSADCAAQQQACPSTLKVEGGGGAAAGGSAASTAAPEATATATTAAVAAGETTGAGAAATTTAVAATSAATDAASATTTAADATATDAGDDDECDAEDEQA